MSSAPPSRSAIAELKDRDLVRLHWPAELRPAFNALFGIDDAMGDVALRARDPTLAAIKLAWWREQLQALDRSRPPPEPRLQAAADELISRGLTGDSLSSIEDGWLPLLDATLDRALAETRGEVIFGLAASLLGEHMDVREQGRAWAAADLARRTGELSWLDRTRPRFAAAPRGIRPLTALAALAIRDHRGRDLEPEGTPGRAWALMRHRLTGR